MLVSYGSVTILAVAFTAPTTFLVGEGSVLGDPTTLELAETTAKAITVGAIFSVVGAATADSVF